MRGTRPGRPARPSGPAPAPGGGRGPGCPARPSPLARLAVALTVTLAVTGVAALAGVTLLPASPASAHATLQGTVPAADQLVDAPPPAVELTFDEPVEALAGAVEVYGPEGGRVDTGEVEAASGGAVVRAPLEQGPEGTYTVAWRVTSEDGHTLAGSFVFHVGRETGAVAVDDGSSTVTDVVGGVGRWLGFAGTLSAAGAALLCLLVARDEGASRRRLGALAGIAAAVGVAGVATSLVATVADSAGRSLPAALRLVPDLAWDTRSGQLSVIRIALGLLVMVAALARPLWRASPAPAAALALGSLAVASVAGHAWTAPSRGVAVAADVVHLGALALWVGGVAALLVALPVATDRLAVASRFSALATGAVGVVVASGVVSGWQQVRSLDGLLHTGYGQLLVVKVLVFLPLLALGYANRYHLVPLVERAAAPLVRSLRAEVAVVGAVLAITASLIHQAPARATLVEPYDTTVTVDGGTMAATVDPATTGPNDIHLYFTDPDGHDMAVDAVEVTAATPGVPARRLAVTPILPNHVTVPGASLPSPGAWTIEVTAVVRGTPLTYTFEVPIR
jgi:copper transport protein